MLDACIIATSVALQTTSRSPTGQQTCLLHDCFGSLYENRGALKSMVLESSSAFLHKHGTTTGVLHGLCTHCLRLFWLVWHDFAEPVQPAFYVLAFWLQRMLSCQDPYYQAEPAACAQRLRSHRHPHQLQPAATKQHFSNNSNGAVQAFWVFVCLLSPQTQHSTTLSNCSVCDA